MKTVAVLGAGPAGAVAAEKLASAGLKTIVFDEKLAWEKPCGGGVTFKAYNKYPFLIQNETPKKIIRQTTITAPKAGDVTMNLERPIVIYSRLDLNRTLLERAEKAGAALEKTRVLGIDRRENGWNIRTRSGTAEADFCVVATGARNPLRDVGTAYTAGDTMSALGYFVPADRDRIDIQFLPGLEGYIWVFPRAGHLSVGICGKGESAHALRVRLERYMDEQGIPWKGSAFYSHMLPSLETPGWKKNRVSGDRWLAAGDAAGLVDPITGEGIYYAIRSGDLAAQTVLSEAHGIAEKAKAYRELIAREFTHDLEFAATLARRVFLGRFLNGPVPARMVQFTRRSKLFRALMQDLFAGTQPYMDLRRRLVKNLYGTIHEVAFNFLFQRVIQEESQPSL
jgi:geranylgeranyl reductase family protein